MLQKSVRNSRGMEFNIIYIKGHQPHIYRCHFSNRPVLASCKLFFFIHTYVYIYILHSYFNKYGKKRIFFRRKKICCKRKKKNPQRQYFSALASVVFVCLTVTNVCYLGETRPRYYLYNERSCYSNLLLNKNNLIKLTN